MLTRRAPLVCLLAFLATRPVLAQPFQPQPHDWPQWQGPHRDAISDETGLLQDWPKGGPDLLWKVDNLGTGFSTPSVAAGRIFTMGHKDEKEWVFCLRDSDGRLLWETPIGPAKRVSYPGTRCTPTVDGDRLYALGVHGALACLNVADGKVVWERDLAKDFNGRKGGWGYAESPLVDGDKLIVTPGGSAATLVALDKADGEVIWKAKVPNNLSAGYSSVIKVDVDGLPQYIQFLGRGQGTEAERGAVVGVRAADGEFLWSYTDPGNKTANISTPVFADNYVFAASAYGTGGALAKLTRDGDRATAEVVYFTPNMQNHHGGMILLDGYLYGSNGGQLVCLDFKTGEVQWKSGTPRKGSITYADGRLYYREERRGTVYLIEANPREFVLHGSFEQPDRSDANAWPHPVVANGRLYLADQNVLLCYDVKDRGTNGKSE